MSEEEEEENYSDSIDFVQENQDEIEQNQEEDEEEDEEEEYSENPVSNNCDQTSYSKFNEYNKDNQEQQNNEQLTSEADSQCTDNFMFIQQYDLKHENKVKVTPPFLTKYEKARVIDTRALQIAQKNPLPDDIVEQEDDPIIIAEREFVQKKIRFIIRRYLPNNKYEDWPLQQLQFLD